MSASNVQIGICNGRQCSVIAQNNNVVITGEDVIVNGVKMPPCPATGYNSMIADGKVYLNGYELVNNQWKKTIKALWYKWF